MDILVRIICFYFFLTKFSYSLAILEFFVKLIRDFFKYYYKKQKELHIIIYSISLIENCKQRNQICILTNLTFHTLISSKKPLENSNGTQALRCLFIRFKLEQIECYYPNYYLFS